MNENIRNILIMVILIGVIVIWKSFNKDETYIEEVEKLNIKSVVLRKFINYDNHGIHYVIFNNDSISIDSNWDSYIEIGDSIIKSEGSTEFIVKNINKYIKFDYNNPGQLPPP